jgi:hypothetical protein
LQAEGGVGGGGVSVAQRDAHTRLGAEERRVVADGERMWRLVVAGRLKGGER